MAPVVCDGCLAKRFSYENTQINYSPAVTAVGHASIYTGSVPALNGIAGNWFWEDGKNVYCCADTTVRSVGSNSAEGQMSPRRMLGTTIGDELHLATDFLVEASSVWLSRTVPPSSPPVIVPMLHTGGILRPDISSPVRSI